MNLNFAGAKRERPIIQSFVEYLAGHGYPGIQVQDWPEDRNKNDIDAIANGLAIEHTSIDTLPNQRQKSAWFLKVVADLEAEFRNQPGFRLHITFPYDAIKRKQEWSKIKSELKNWILQTAPKLSDGHHRIQLAPLSCILNVNKSSSRKPGLFFARSVLEDDSLSERIGESIRRKSKKLVRYKEKGFKALLLLESDDIALMNTHKMARAIKAGCPDGKPDWIDEIWFADTSIDTEMEFHNFTNLF